MEEPSVAIWRDPLDELIEDLEKTIPGTQQCVPDLFALEDMQAAICPITNFDEAAIERSKSNPGAQRFWAWVEAHPNLGGRPKSAVVPVDEDDSLARLLEDEADNAVGDRRGTGSDPDAADPRRPTADQVPTPEQAAAIRRQQWPV